MQKIAIIGNGSLNVDSRNNRFLINNHTGLLLQELIKAGNDILYIEPFAIYNSNADLVNFCLKKENIPFWGFNKSNKLNLFKSIFSLINKIRQTTFVYIFLPGSLGMLSAIIAICLRKKIGIYLRGDLGDINLKTKWILKDAKFILSVSPLLNKLISSYNKNVQCIKPMIWVALNDLREKKITTEPNKTWQFLFVGNLSPTKGIYELIEVANILNQNKISFHFTLVGAGVLYNELLEKYKNREIPQNITIAGLVNDKSELLNLYRCSDIFFFPTHTEGFARTLFEAMSQSLPIFTTMVGGISGYMTNYYNCFEIPLQQPIEQARIVMQHLENVDALNKVANNGYITIKNVLTDLTPHHQLIINYLNELN